MNDVTRILNDGDSNATARLSPTLYEELRKLATARMAGEKPGQTIPATGLVHEAWIRLVGSDANWKSRGHFFAAAAEAMRRVLIDNARRKQAAKHGGGHRRADVDLEEIEAGELEERLLDLDDALSKAINV